MTIRTIATALLTLAVLSGCATTGAGLNHQAHVSDTKLRQARALVDSQRHYNDVVYRLSLGAGACGGDAAQYRAPFSLLFNNKAIKDTELRNALYAVLGAEDLPVLQAHTPAMRQYDGAQVVSINGKPPETISKALRAQMEAADGAAPIRLQLADGRAVSTQAVGACPGLVMVDSTQTITGPQFMDNAVELTPVSWTQLAGDVDEQAFILARSVYFTGGEGRQRLRNAQLAGKLLNAAAKSLSHGTSALFVDLEMRALAARRNANRSDADAFALRLMRDAGFNPAAAMAFARRSQAEGAAWPTDCDELKFDAERIANLGQAL